MSNGRCFRGDRYESLRVANRSDEENCEYLLKCVLSMGMEQNCSCYRNSRCLEEFSRACRLSLIQYPRRAVVTPFIFFLFKRGRTSPRKGPDFIQIDGTVRCRNSLITVTKRIPFDYNWNEHQMIEEHFCGPFMSNISSSALLSTRQLCHHWNESNDLCNEWNPCLSRTRIRDGAKNCLKGKDEEEQQTEMTIEKNCARVRRHRFLCSNEDPSCLSVLRLGNRYSECRNRFDELWFGVGRTVSSIECNNQRQDQCSLLRQYIEQSTTKSDLQKRSRLPFRSHCDTFNDLPSREDENRLECQQWWICPDDQKRCQTGQCVEEGWTDDHEWDCSDASDEHRWLNWLTRWALHGASEYDFTNRSFYVPSTCTQSHPFLCLSSLPIQQGFSCFNLSQIGDGNIDCAGGIDERNTLKHCSQSLSMLGNHFQCPSTNTCIPFSLHCLGDSNRCPNRADDEFWCDRQHRSSNCFGVNDFTCFDGRCAKGGRCDAGPACLFGEDEYMCDPLNSLSRFLVSYREEKQFSRGRISSILDLRRFSSNVNITQLDSQSPSMTYLSSSLSPYWCNRGLGVLTTKNYSIILCFCPPQYYGEKCQFHSNRLSVILHLDVSQSNLMDRNDEKVLLQLVVLFLFNDEVLSIDQFHLHPTVKLNSLLNKKRNKLISHFLYPHSSIFLQQRRTRYFNRSSLLSRSPFSIRVELYQTRLNKRPSILGLWKYLLDFTHLPVSRLSKVLHFDQSSTCFNPCSSHPCPRNAQCHQLINNKSEFICICKTNFTGESCSEEDQQCRQGYCTSTGSLCQPNSRSSLQRNKFPFCLCPLNHYGPRCSIEYDACLSLPCQNNGSCFPDVQPDRVICLCLKEYFGSHCQMKRSSIHFSLLTDLIYQGLVLQVFQIDLSPLELILLQQQAFLQIPSKMDYYHQDQSLITGIALAKVYSSSEVSTRKSFRLTFEQAFLRSIDVNIKEHSPPSGILPPFDIISCALMIPLVSVSAMINIFVFVSTIIREWNVFS